MTDGSISVYASGVTQEPYESGGNAVYGNQHCID